MSDKETGMHLIKRRPMRVQVRTGYQIEEQAVLTAWLTFLAIALAMFGAILFVTHHKSLFPSWLFTAPVDRLVILLAILGGGLAWLVTVYLVYRVAGGHDGIADLFRKDPST